MSGQSGSGVTEDVRSDLEETSKNTSDTTALLKCIVDLLKEQNKLINKILN